MAVSRSPDFSATKRPNPSDGAEKRTLSRTGSSPEQDGFSARNRKVHVCDKRLTIGQIESQIINFQVRSVPLGALDATTGRRLDAYPRKRLLKTSETLNHRAPFSNDLIRVDEKAQRCLYLAESANGLYQSAQGNISREIARCSNERREYPTRLLIPRGEIGQPLLAPHDVPPVRHHRRKPFPKAMEFVGFASIERYSFGILAEAYQAKSEVRFATLLVVVESH